MAQTNILLEAGTNELEIVEFFIDEPTASSFTADAPENSGHYRGYYGVNVAKVLEIIRLPKVTAMPEVSHPIPQGTELREVVVERPLPRGQDRHAHTVVGHRRHIRLPGVGPHPLRWCGFHGALSAQAIPGRGAQYRTRRFADHHRHGHGRDRVHR